MSSISFTASVTARTTIYAFQVFHFKDTHREKAPLNSSAYEKYEYGHLGCWYIKLNLFKKF